MTIAADDLSHNIPGMSGAYMARLTTGIIGATLAADGVVAAIRNGPTANNKKVYITDLKFSVCTVAAFTAVQQFGLYLERFTGANPAGGAAYDPFHLSSEYPASACLPGGTEGGDVRAATTAALTVAGISFEGRKVPMVGWSAVTAGAQYEFGLPYSLLDARLQPIILKPGEGLAIRNLIVWPAAGTAIFTGFARWIERAE